MRNKHIKIMMGSFILIICLALMTPIALAVEEAVAESINVFMPSVSISLTGASLDEPEDYEIVLEADDPAFPMPEGSQEGAYRLIITGDDMAMLPSIQFSSIGIYTYNITQTPGTNELGNYDESVYHITVYITNAIGGEGFASTVIARKNDEAEKLADIEFINDYELEIIDEEVPGGEIKIPEEEIELPDEEIPGAEADPPGSDVPQTSDNTIIWPYILSFIGAGILLLILVFSSKSRVKE